MSGLLDELRSQGIPDLVLFPQIVEPFVQLGYGVWLAIGAGPREVIESAGSGDGANSNGEGSLNRKVFFSAFFSFSSRNALLFFNFWRSSGFHRNRSPSPRTNSQGSAGTYSYRLIHGVGRVVVIVSVTVTMGIGCIGSGIARGSCWAGAAQKASWPLPECRHGSKRQPSACLYKECIN